jgi:hypothetical protein
MKTPIAAGKHRAREKRAAQCLAFSPAKRVKMTPVYEEFDFSDSLALSRLRGVGMGRARRSAAAFLA